MLLAFLVATFIPRRKTPAPAAAHEQTEAVAAEA